MTYGEWLQTAAGKLADNLFASARLDAEIILAHTIGHPRTYLHAHAEETLDRRRQEIADARVDLRLEYVPIAYIIGHKEFYGRRFHVSPAVLIPRPESEQIIDLLNDVLAQQSLLPETTMRLVDIGAGSGCLGITAKLEHPELDVTLLDTSRASLTVAEKNARSLAADVSILQSDLLDSYPYNPDIVLANLPYVDESWERSEETRHEPSEALFANRGGLSVIERCFEELAIRLQPGAVAIFEADPRQWTDITKIARRSGFRSEREMPFAVRYMKD